MACIATTPRGGQHELVEIDRRNTIAAPDGVAVTRWCRLCGGVVIDLDTDGRTHPGAIMKMQFPALTQKGSQP